MSLPSGTRNMSYGQDMAIFRTRLQWALLIAFLVLLGLLPLFLSSSTLRLVCTISIIIIAVQGLNIALGYCGQVSLAQAALMAVGGYTSAILATKCGMPFWITLPCAGLVCSLIGVIFGLPSLKIKGMYLAMATLAAHFIIIYVLTNALGLTGGDAGMSAPRPHLGIIDFQSDRSYYYIIMVVAVLATLFAKNLVRTRVGRAFVAIRDNDIAAEVMGVNLARYKLLAFLICSFYAGIAGALWAHFDGVIHPETFSLMDSIWFLGMVIIGGGGSIMGIIFGVVFLRLLDRLAVFVGPMIAAAIPALSAGICASLGQILFGVVIVLFIVFEPRGIAHRWEVFKSYYRIWPFPY